MMDVDRALSPEERKLFTPRDVRVGLLGNGRRSVSWTPPASERPVASYRVWSDAVQVAEVPGTQTSEIVQLDGARTHYIQVQAVDADGNESNLTVHWVIGRPTADHRMNPRADADRDPQESVNAPDRKWTTPADDALARERRRAALANALAKWSGWVGLMCAVISLPFLIRVSLGTWQPYEFSIAALGVGLSFMCGVVGLIMARFVPRQNMLRSSKIAAVLAVAIGVLGGAVVELTRALNEFVNYPG